MPRTRGGRRGHAPHAHHDLPPGHGGPGGTTQPARGGGGRRGSPGGIPTQRATRGARSAPSGRYRPAKGGPGTVPREERGAANAAHVLRARRQLRHLVPFLLDAGAKTTVEKALKELNDWAREYWGPELVEIVEEDDENDTGGRPEHRAQVPRARVPPPPPPEAELKGESTDGSLDGGSQAPAH